MKTLNFLFLIIFVVLILGLLRSCKSCDTNKNTTEFIINPPFSIDKIYYQKWIAGTQGGGSGVNLYVEFSQINKGVLLNEFYFRNNIAAVKKSNESLYVGHFNANEIRSIQDNDRQNEVINPLSFESKFKLENHEAILSYQYDNVFFHYKISNINEKEIVAYPAIKD